MKSHLDIKHEGSLGSEHRTRMTFDENSISHLMSVLTDLYSNPTLAVVREYSTNAYDAHVAAGNSAPIEVTLPTIWTMLLVIKDFGTGMSMDQITENFSKYGWSSKRDNDDEVGMLGLGSKSGLTYTSQFTLVSVKDGEKVTVLVTREETGGGVVQIIDKIDTDEPNGTEVQIPVKNVENMRSTAMEFYSYWDEGTVLVDGEQPPSIWAHEKITGAIRLDDDIVLIPIAGETYGHQRGKSLIVMGNVAYPVDELKLPSNLQRNIDRMRAIIRVPIGCVNFTPSRESLTYNKRTLETIGDAWEYIYHGIFQMVQDEIEQAPNGKKAWEYWTAWYHVLQNVNRQAGAIQYKGETIVSHLEIPNVERTLLFNVRKHGYHADKSERADRRMELKKLYAPVLHVVGFNGTAVPASTKERVRLYCAEKGIDSGTVIMYPRPFGAPWLTNETVRRVRFDVIQAIKLPDQELKERKRRDRAKYRTLWGEGELQNHEDLPDNIVCWVPAGYSGYSTTKTEMVQFAGEHKVASVLQADEKRFARDHPDVPHWEEYVKATCSAAPLSGDEWDAFFYHIENATHVRVPDVIRYSRSDLLKNLQDPDLVDFIREHANRQHHARLFRDRLAVAQRMARRYSIVMPKVPTSPVFGRFNKLVSFYEGLLDLQGGRHDNSLAKALNAFYIVKYQLNVIPVY